MQALELGLPAFALQGLAGLALWKILHPPRHWASFLFLLLTLAGLITLSVYNFSYYWPWTLAIWLPLVVAWLTLIPLIINYWTSKPTPTPLWGLTGPLAGTAFLLLSLTFLPAETQKRFLVGNMEDTSHLVLLLLSTLLITGILIFRRKSFYPSPGFFPILVIVVLQWALVLFPIRICFI